MPDELHVPDKLRKAKVDEMLQWLGVQLREVGDLPEERRGFLTSEQLDFLTTLAKKNIDQLPLSADEMEARSHIHQKVGYVLRDVRLLIRCGFIGARSEWDPGGFIHDHIAARVNGKEPSRPERTLPYVIDTWKEDVSVGTLADIVRTFVEMYGDEYAVPLARSIELGLQEREDRTKVTVEVPVVRRAKVDWRWE
jgi:hypothetical protein